LVISYVPVISTSSDCAYTHRVGFADLAESQQRYWLEY